MSNYNLSTSELNMEPGICSSLQLSIADELLAIEKHLSNILSGLNFQLPVCYVYNPLEYAYLLHSMFVRKYCDSPKRVLFLGMNPGPWGMSQTGVPFGEISVVRDWLKLDGPVGRPHREHPLRPVTGLACHRSEISGRRFWGLLRRICSTPTCALKHAAIYNHCPIALLSDSGRNITPSELKRTQLEPLLRPCDSALASVLRLLQVNILVAVGKFAESRAKIVLRVNPDLQKEIKIVYLPHPSPRNLAIKDWEETAAQHLQNENFISESMSKLGLKNMSAEEVYSKNEECEVKDKLKEDESDNIVWDLSHYPFAERAFELAREGLAAGEVPIGCVFAYFPESDSERPSEPIIIAEDYNTPNKSRNPTRHAEMNAVDKAIDWAESQKIPLQSLWPRTSVIVTVEPCVMCASALLTLGVRHVRYGCKNDRFGGCGSIVDVAAVFGPQAKKGEKPVQCPEFVGGWRSKEAMELLKEFYRGENPNAPKDKVKKKKKKNGNVAEEYKVERQAYVTEVPEQGTTITVGKKWKKDKKAKKKGRMLEETKVDRQENVGEVDKGVPEGTVEVNRENEGNIIGVEAQANTEEGNR